jgi:hypothetical protein
MVRPGATTRVRAVLWVAIGAVYTLSAADFAGNWSVTVETSNEPVPVCLTVNTQSLAQETQTRGNRNGLNARQGHLAGAMLRWAKHKTCRLEWLSTQPLYTVYGMTVSLPKNVVFEPGQLLKIQQRGMVAWPACSD